MTEGPTTDKRLRCYGCDNLRTWWNGGPNLHAKCEKVDRFIDGRHGPGKAGNILMPAWCPCRPNAESEGLT